MLEWRRGLYTPVVKSDMLSSGSQISLPPAAAVSITEKLASSQGVQLTGLGARDSLRLEAGMCLYGNDLDESISPVEAGLSWVVGESVDVLLPSSLTIFLLLNYRQGQTRYR